MVVISQKTIERAKFEPYVAQIWRLATNDFLFSFMRDFA